jgi:hypothetical protein
MALTVTIGGVTKTPVAMTLSSAQNERDRLTLTLVSDTGANIRPNIDDEVLVVEDSVTIFGGSVKTPELSGLGTSPTAVSARASCLDYNELGDRIVVVGLTIPTGTLKAAATALLPYLPGVSIDSSWTSDGPTLPELVYDGLYADAALEDLSTRTGWVRNINATKKLKFWTPGTIAAPWNVTDGDGNVVGDLTSVITRKDYANRIIVKFLDAAISAWGFFGPKQGMSSLPSAGETVTVGSKTYTWRATLGAPANEVLIGADVSACISNLACAIVEGDGKGPTYSTATTANTQVIAWQAAPDRMTVKAQTAGAAGNNLALTTNCANWRCYHEGNIEWGHLQGGADEAFRNSVQVDAVALQPPVYTRIVEAANVYNVTDATAIGEAILTEATVVMETVRYKTRRSGLTVGMSQTIASAKRHVTSATFLITAIETTWSPGGLAWRDVTAIKGTTYRNTSWRELYKQWSGASGTAQSVTYGGVGGGGSSPTARVYTLGGSRSLYVAPNPKAWTPVPEWIPFKAPAGFSARVRVWMWARNAGITVSARVTSGTDGITFGTVSASLADVTGQTVTERTADFVVEADKYYRLEVYPSSNGEGVGCLGYVESL